MKEQLLDEVPQFVGYLKGHAVDMNSLNRVVRNEARKVLIDLSKTNTTMFFESVRNKNWIWLKDNLVPVNLKILFPNDKYFYKEAKEFLDMGIPVDKIHRDDLRTVYNNIFQTHKNAGQFTHLCNLYGLPIKAIKINDTTQQGYKW